MALRGDVAILASVRVSDNSVHSAAVPDKPAPRLHSFDRTDHKQRRHTRVATLGVDPLPDHSLAAPHPMLVPTAMHLMPVPTAWLPVDWRRSPVVRPRALQELHNPAPQAADRSSQHPAQRVAMEWPMGLRSRLGQSAPLEVQRRYQVCSPERPWLRSANL